MLSFILTVGAVLLYFIIGAVVAFPARMFVWWLTFVFDGVNAADIHSDKVFFLFILIWPFVVLYLIYLFIKEGAKNAIRKNQAR